MKTLFKRADLLHADGTMEQGVDVMVAEGRIAAMGDGLPADGAEVIDCKGQVLSPGLTVLHAHSPMHILRGLAEDVHIDAWFNEEIFPYESKLTDEDIYWGSRLCFAEMAEHGVTAVADHYFAGDAIVDAASEAGIRLDLAPTLFGHNLQEGMEETKRLIERERKNERCHIRFGPHSPYLLNPEQLAQVVQAAKQHHTGIHLHVAETQVQEQNSREQYGKSHCQIVQEAGGFELPCIVAHGLWIAPEEVAWLGAQTHVAVSPKTYMKLGMGKGTLWRNWRQMQLCSGTDGAASSNSVSPLEQVRLFALCGKWDDKAEDFTLRDMWRVLMNGHRALGFGSGHLAVGASADLVVWELNTAETLPAYQPLTAILYSAGPQNVRHTMVAGHFTKKDGLLCDGKAKIYSQVKRHAEEILRRGKGEAAMAF